MDTSQIVIVVGFVVSIATILFGVVALMWQINSQSNRLEAKMEAQGKELRDEIKEQGARVSQSELDQARLNGVNSVLLRHTHTHESVDDDD